MARTKFPDIIIEGTFAREVLGTFNIIRGFATLQELAKISSPVFMREVPGTAAVQGHQRPLDQDHAEEIKRYFEDGDRRFIPEVILSIRASSTAEMVGQRQVGVRCSADGFSIRRKHKSKNLDTHVIRVDGQHIQVVKNSNRIRRIDGNHRLELASQLQFIASQPNKYKVPFCIILLGDRDNNTADDYTEALVFHSINSTAKPLDSEHALRLILGQPPGETMRPEQEFAFNPNLHFTRLLHDRFASLTGPARNRLGIRPLASLAIAAKEMLQAYPEKKASLEALEGFATELNDVLFDICTRMTPAHADLCQAEYFVELAAHVWMQAAGDNHDEKVAVAQRYLEQMAGWLGREGMRNLSSGKPLGKQLLVIYEEIRRRIPRRVFLARWYPKVSDGDQKTRADRRLQQLRLLVETELNLELFDLGTEEGGTELIHPKMYEAIASSDIFIADLTGHRPNVMIEIGYALKHQDKGRLLLYFEPSEGMALPPFDVSGFRYEAITQAADIPDALRGHITTILQEASAGVI